MITKEQIETPALLIDLDVLDKNIKTMADYMSNKRSKLRPHFKTFKCVQIAHKTILSGAKGITCSKLSEAEVLVNGGIKDVLIANQVVDKDKIFKLAGIARGDSKITVAVDNEENVIQLSKAASLVGSTIYILIEVDVGMKRCGVNSAEEVLNLTKKISKSNGLSFEGIQAYEGHLGHIYDIEDRYAGVQKMVKKIGKIKDHLRENGYNVNEISGGATGTYNITGENTIWTEIQAGSYIFMDTDYNRLGLPFGNALTVLSTVIHKRNGYAITDAGLKVCSTDEGMPIIKNFPHLKLQENEEHGVILDSGNELKYLQKIEYIPSHCCTTVNLHDRYYCIRNNLLESVWPIEGRGKSQ